MKNSDIYWMLLPLSLLLSWAALSSCASEVYVEDCQQVSQRHNIWKCKQ